MLQLPLAEELRFQIYEETWPPGCDIKTRDTALLSVCKDIYAEAQPIFLRNALFHCVPLRLSHVRPSTGEKVKGGIAEIIRPFDLDVSWHLDHEDWMEGLKEELSCMFDKDAKDRYISKRRGPEWAPWLSDDNGDDDDDSESDEEEVEQESDDDLDASSIDFELRQSYKDEFYYGLIDDDWDFHGARNAKEMITYCRFLQGMRLLGQEKCTQIRHLRIIWGERERCGDSYAESGPMAIALIALLAGFWLPNLTYIHLRQLVRDLNGEELSDCDCLYNPCGVYTDNINFEIYHAENAKSWILGIDENGARLPEVYDHPYGAKEGKLVQSLDLLDASCPMMQELCFEDWHRCHGDRTIPSHWYTEILQREGLQLVMQTKYPERVNRAENQERMGVV